jgi:signal transduction histidine kinase
VNFSTAWQGKKVLIVDDSATSRILMVELLRDLPLELEQAHSAAQFRERTAAQVYDIILLDLRLANEDGIALLRSFRKHCQLTAVILITGQASLSSATEALAEGADGYVEKSHLKQGPVAFQLTLEKALLQREQRLARQELSQIKDEFHAVMVHDLRGPAASASVALRMYQESARPEILDSAVRSLDRLFHRLDRYLDFFRMESLAWKMNLQLCDLNEILEDVVTATEHLFHSKDQTLRWTPLPAPLLQRLDPDWILQAVENLLINAAKYTPPFGDIQLNLEHNQQSITIKVSDNGPGIPSELQSQLFHRYARVHRAQPEQGAGLGLLIARQVVEAHGGTVKLQSTGVNGEGTTFFLNLPLVGPNP